MKYKLRYQWTFKRFRNPDKRYVRTWITVFARDKKQALKVGLKWMKWWCKNGNRSHVGLDWEKAENILCEPVETKGHASGQVSHAPGYATESPYDEHDYVYIVARKDSALAKKMLARNSEIK